MKAEGDNKCDKSKKFEYKICLNLDKHDSAKMESTSSNSDWESPGQCILPSFTNTSTNRIHSEGFICRNSSDLVCFNVSETTRNNMRGDDSMNKSRMRILRKLYLARSSLTPVIDEIISSASTLKDADFSPLPCAACSICSITMEQLIGAIQASKIMKEVNDELIEECKCSQDYNQEEINAFSSRDVTINMLYYENELMDEHIDYSERIYIDKDLMKQLIELHELLADTIKKLNQKELQQRESSRKSGTNIRKTYKSNHIPQQNCRRVSAGSLREFAELQNEYDDLDNSVMLEGCDCIKKRGSDSKIGVPEKELQGTKKSKSQNVMAGSDEKQGIVDINDARRCILECLAELAEVRVFLQNVNQEELDLSSQIQLSEYYQNNECCSRQNIPHLHAKMNGIPIVLKLNQETVDKILSKAKKYRSSEENLKDSGQWPAKLGKSVTAATPLATTGCQCEQNRNTINFCGGTDDMLEKSNFTPFEREIIASQHKRINDTSSRLTSECQCDLAATKSYSSSQKSKINFCGGTDDTVKKSSLRLTQETSRTQTKYVPPPTYFSKECQCDSLAHSGTQKSKISFSEETDDNEIRKNFAFSAPSTKSSQCDSISFPSCLCLQNSKSNETTKSCQCALLPLRSCLSLQKNKSNQTTESCQCDSMILQSCACQQKSESNQQTKSCQCDPQSVYQDDVPRPNNLKSCQYDPQSVYQDDVPRPNNLKSCQCDPQSVYQDDVPRPNNLKSCTCAAKLRTIQSCACKNSKRNLSIQIKQSENFSCGSTSSQISVSMQTLKEIQSQKSLASTKSINKQDTVSQPPARRYSAPTDSSKNRPIAPTRQLSAPSTVNKTTAVTPRHAANQSATEKIHQVNNSDYPNNVTSSACDSKFSFNPCVCKKNIKNPEKNTLPSKHLSSQPPSNKENDRRNSPPAVVRETSVTSSKSSKDGRSLSLSLTLAPIAEGEITTNKSVGSSNDDDYYDAIEDSDNSSIIVRSNINGSKETLRVTQNNGVSKNKFSLTLKENNESKMARVTTIDGNNDTPLEIRESQPAVPYTASARSIPNTREKNRTCPSLEFDVTIVASGLRRNGILHPDNKIERRLKEMGIDNIMRACRPAKCCRKAILNEKIQTGLPYPASLASLHLDETDVDIISETVRVNADTKKLNNKSNIYNAYHSKLQYYSNLQLDNFNPKNFPWVIPSYEVRFFEILKQNTSNDRKLTSTSNKSSPKNVLKNVDNHNKSLRHHFPWPATTYEVRRFNCKRKSKQPSLDTVGDTNALRSKYPEESFVVDEIVDRNTRIQSCKIEESRTFEQNKLTPEPWAPFVASDMSLPHDEEPFQDIKTVNGINVKCDEDSLLSRSVDIPYEPSKTSLPELLKLCEPGLTSLQMKSKCPYTVEKDFYSLPLHPSGSSLPLRHSKPPNSICLTKYPCKILMGPAGKIFIPCKHGTPKTFIPCNCETPNKTFSGKSEVDPLHAQQKSTEVTERTYYKQEVSKSFVPCSCEILNNFNPCKCEVPHSPRQRKSEEATTSTTYKHVPCHCEIPKTVNNKGTDVNRTINQTDKNNRSDSEKTKKLSIQTKTADLNVRDKSTQDMNTESIVQGPVFISPTSAAPKARQVDKSTQDNSTQLSSKVSKSTEPKVKEGIKNQNCHCKKKPSLKTLFDQPIITTCCSIQHIFDPMSTETRLSGGLGKTKDVCYYNTAVNTHKQMNNRFRNNPYGNVHIISQEKENTNSPFKFKQFKKNNKVPQPSNFWKESNKAVGFKSDKSLRPKQSVSEESFTIKVIRNNKSKKSKSEHSIEGLDDDDDEVYLYANNKITVAKSRNTSVPPKLCIPYDQDKLNETSSFCLLNDYVPDEKRTAQQTASFPVPKLRNSQFTKRSLTSPEHLNSIFEEFEHSLPKNQRSGNSSPIYATRTNSCKFNNQYYDLKTLQAPSINKCSQANPKSTFDDCVISAKKISPTMRKCFKEQVSDHCDKTTPKFKDPCQNQRVLQKEEYVLNKRILTDSLHVDKSTEIGKSKLNNANMYCNNFGNDSEILQPAVKYITADQIAYTTHRHKSQHALSNGQSINCSPYDEQYSNNMQSASPSCRSSQVYPQSQQFTQEDKLHRIYVAQNHLHYLPTDKSPLFSPSYAKSIIFDSKNKPYEDNNLHLAAIMVPKCLKSLNKNQNMPTGHYYDPMLSQFPKDLCTNKCYVGQVETKLANPLQQNLFSNEKKCRLESNQNEVFHHHEKKLMTFKDQKNKVVTKGNHDSIILNYYSEGSSGESILGTKPATLPASSTLTQKQMKNSYELMFPWLDIENSISDVAHTKDATAQTDWVAENNDYIETEVKNNQKKVIPLISTAEDALKYSFIGNCKQSMKESGNEFYLHDSSVNSLETSSDEMQQQMFNKYLVNWPNLANSYAVQDVQVKPVDTMNSCKCLNFASEEMMQVTNNHAQQQPTKKQVDSHFYTTVDTCFCIAPNTNFISKPPEMITRMCQTEKFIQQEILAPSLCGYDDIGTRNTNSNEVDIQTPALINTRSSFSFSYVPKDVKKIDQAVQACDCFVVTQQKGSTKGQADKSPIVVEENKSMSHNKEEHICWALTKMSLSPDGPVEFEVLEVAPISPGYYIIPSLNPVMLDGQPCTKN